MHSRDLHYVGPLFRAYVTEDKLMQTMKLAEPHARTSPYLVRSEPVTSRTRASIIGNVPDIPIANKTAHITSCGDGPDLASPKAPAAASRPASGSKTHDRGKRSWNVPHTVALTSATTDTNAIRAPICPTDMPMLW